MTTARRTFVHSVSRVTHARRNYGGRGQALVEFSLILPILLVLILGTFQVGLLLGLREQLGHAAREAAIVGCPADETVATLLGRTPALVECHVTDGITEVTVSDPAERVAPFFGDLDVTVTGRAVERVPDATPSPVETLP